MRSWAQSLPSASSAGPGEAFDEFSSAAAPQADHSGTDRLDLDRGETGSASRSAASSPGPSIEAAPPVSEPLEPATRPPAGSMSRPPLAPHDPAEPGRKAIQVHDSYLIAETGDGMMVIDQHALHERILYEELRSRVAAGQVESQRLLVPEPVDLPAAEAGVLVEQTELLAQLGLDIEPFGGDTVLVRSIPAMLPHVVPDRLVRDLAEHLRTQPLPPTRDGLLAELMHMVACKAAVKAGQPLSSPEIAALLERRHLVANSHHCPHGRPTALLFTKADLEKQFGRT